MHTHRRRGTESAYILSYKSSEIPQLLILGSQQKNDTEKANKELPNISSGQNTCVLTSPLANASAEVLWRREGRPVCLKIKCSEAEGSKHWAVIFGSIWDRNHCNQTQVVWWRWAEIWPLYTANTLHFIAFGRPKKDYYVSRQNKIKTKIKIELWCWSLDNEIMNCSFYSNNLIHYGTGQRMIKDEQRSPRV